MVWFVENLLSLPHFYQIMRRVSMTRTGHPADETYPDALHSLRCLDQTAARVVAEGDWSRHRDGSVKSSDVCARIRNAVFLQLGNGPAQRKGVNPVRSGRKQR